MLTSKQLLRIFELRGRTLFGDSLPFLYVCQGVTLHYLLVQANSGGIWGGSPLLQTVKEALSMPFGGRLRELRQSKGLTLRALAERVGLDFTYLSKIENGKVEYTPSADKIRALARALGADELELLELAGKAPPELGAIVSHPSARAFLRRAQGLTSPEDWEDLLNYLDQRQAEREQKKGDKNR